jgi:tetratricopeptide (TPR) repeat protein
MEAREYYDRALAIHTESGDILETSRTQTSMANMYREWGDYPRAIELLLQARKGFQEVHYTEGLAWTGFSLGTLHKRLKNYDLALESIKQSLEIYNKLAEETGNNNGIMICYGQLGDIYSLSGSLEKGLEYHILALKMREENGSQPAIADGLSGVGQSYFRLGEFERALDYFQRSLKVRQEAGRKRGTENNQMFIGEIYREMSQFDKALEHFDRGLEIARDLSNREAESEILEKKADLLAEMGRHREAWVIFQEHRVAQDQVLNAEISKRIASLQLQHEIADQAAENEKLQRENEIKDLQLGRSRIMFILAVFVTVFAVSGGIVAVYLHRKKLQIQTLQGLIPICSHCKSIRNDKGYYEQLETYISSHSEAQFSHGVCPECLEKYYRNEIIDPAHSNEESIPYS